MAEQGYGRIVMTTSTGMLGLPANAAYATAKGGVVGLSRSLATAGARCGIKVNLIAPAATTRMAGEGGPAEAVAHTRGTSWLAALDRAAARPADLLPCDHRVRPRRGAYIVSYVFAVTWRYFL